MNDALNPTEEHAALRRTIREFVGGRDRARRVGRLFYDPFFRAAADMLARRETTRAMYVTPAVSRTSSTVSSSRVRGGRQESLASVNCIT
jgi:hypothetical protein